MLLKRKISGVIFDMDGVLIDSEPRHYDSTIKYLNGELGLAYNQEENREFLGRSDEYMFRVLQQRYQLSFSVREMIERRRDIYLDLLVGNVVLVPGVSALIKNLHDDGYCLGLASSSLEKIIDVVIAEGGVKKYFSVVQSGEHLANCKPHPEIFLVTAGKMGLAPELCAVIEDTAVGIQAARVAGMMTVAYDAPGAPAQDFSAADIVVRSFTDENIVAIFRD
jgi:HAD superfamily hydrolase (TIGR01509 family)